MRKVGGSELLAIQDFVNTYPPAYANGWLAYWIFCTASISS